jgi:hypothetical protein
MSTLSETSQSGLGWVFPPQPQTQINRIDEVLGVISGITPLVAGQSYVDVVFGTTQPNSNWTPLEASIINTTDSTPLNVWPGIITSKTTTGFRLQLNGTADSSNYFLFWSIEGAFGYFLTGPTTGEELITSTPFTVSLAGDSSLTSTVVITPHDGGDGGTFAPTTVTLSVASPTATFTYTPASVGTKAISVTNNRGLTNPAGISYISTPTPPSVHLLNTLISYWKMDEASGNRADSTATANTLTDGNTVTTGTGKINNSAHFTQANSESLSHASNASLQVTGDFTFSCWVKLTTQTGFGGVGAILTKATADGAAFRDYQLMYESSTNGFYFSASVTGVGATATEYAVSAQPIANGVWTHVVVWKDTATGQVYIRINDTTTHQSTTAPALVQSAAVFVIGARNYTAGQEAFLDGDIDEVGFWKRKLNSAEITALYNSGAALPYASFTA